MLLTLFVIIASVSMAIRNVRFLLAVLAASLLFCAGLLYAVAQRRKRKHREKQELIWAAMEARLRELRGKDDV